METLVDIQHWLYRGIGEGLGNVAGGDYRAIMVAMAAAILFGAVHALMPGHGKIVHGVGGGRRGVSASAGRLDIASVDASIRRSLVITSAYGTKRTCKPRR